MPRYKPIRVGDRIAEPMTGHTITHKGAAYYISDREFQALQAAARARKLTTDQLVAVTCTHSSQHIAREALRQVIAPYLPADFAWPVASAAKA